MPASKRPPLHCLVALAATALVLVAPSTASAEAERYIVVLEPGADPRQVANEHARAQGANVKFVYDDALRGYAARIPTARIRAVRNDFRVAYVEHDAPVTAQAQVLPWGIKRIGADRSFTKAGNGSRAISNVRAYVIDSGIDTGLADLNVVRHVNFAGGSNRDCNGHGTHVAGTLGAKDNRRGVVGAAPGAPLIGIKVLDCSGGGSMSTVIKGVDWVTAHARKPAVANLSVAGGATQALDDAVRRSANSGVFYSVAAGNSGANACNFSPARAGTHNGVITTAATGTGNAEASFSNYGGCVDIWAPGVSILSTRLGGGKTTMSGTSMASPHVGGTGALFLSRHPARRPGTVESAIKSNARSTGTASKDGRAIRLDYAGGF